MKKLQFESLTDKREKKTVRKLEFSVILGHFLTASLEKGVNIVFKSKTNTKLEPKFLTQNNNFRTETAKRVIKVRNLLNSFGFLPLILNPFEITARGLAVAVIRVMVLILFG